MFKKIVIADNCAVFVNKVFSTYPEQSGSNLLLAAIFFAFQIYGDFSGYSDIAIGTAKLFGVKLMRNFNVPYFSRNMAELWRRWHISLTTWFRDYVYYPLGGSRVSKAKVVRNTFVIFLLSGFWHGANWTYIVWGAYHAILFLPFIFGKSNKFKNQKLVAENRVLPTFKETSQMLWTFFLFVFGLIIFRSESLRQAWEYFCGICNTSLFSTPNVKGYSALMINILFMLFVEWIQRDRQFVLDLSMIKKGYIRWMFYLIVLVIIFAFGGHATNFIYFQF